VLGFAHAGDVGLTSTSLKQHKKTPDCPPIIKEATIVRVRAVCLLKALTTDVSEKPPKEAVPPK
jgi:hypothetical protein